VINNPTLAAEEGIGLTPWDADRERAKQAEAGVGVRFFLLHDGVWRERGGHGEGIGEEAPTQRRLGYALTGAPLWEG
jgi:hypothetical protein